MSEAVFKTPRYRFIRRAAIEKATQLATRIWRAQDPPYDVSSFAQACGAEVELAQLSESGELFPNFGRGYRIRVNQAESTERQRFTVCHEIGHILFEQHRLFPETNPNPALLVEAFAIEEKVCDRVASHLLMPPDVFIAEASKLPVALRSVNDIGKRFAVTRDAALIRLLELRPWQCGWVKWRIAGPASGVDPEWWWPRDPRRASAERSDVLRCMPALADSVRTAYRSGRIVAHQLTGSWAVESMTVNGHDGRSVLSMLRHPDETAPWASLVR